MLLLSKIKRLPVSPVSFIFWVIICSLPENTHVQCINQEKKQGSDNHNTHYREEYETYETLQRKPLAQHKKELKTRYVEFAETEFSRQSFYLPIPFISRNRLHVIPARTLSQLIRQHIAHNRIKHLELQNAAKAPILQGVRQITELRQTPYRRWSANSTKQQSYEEKRRQWKAELKRRLQSHKIPTRIIPPLLIRGGGHTSIQTDKEPTDRYFVTYSPQTRIYQVSRRPPPFLYTTYRDLLPEEINIDEIQSIIPEPSPASEVQLPEVLSKEYKPTESYQLSTTPSSILLPQLPSTSITVTTTMAPILFVLQRAKLIDDNRIDEHTQQISAINKSKIYRQQIKQIVFIDDYEQVQGDTEDEEYGGMTTPIATIAPKLWNKEQNTTQSKSIDRIAKLEEARKKLQQQLFQENEDGIFAEEDGEDDDLFFFKPGYEKTDNDDTDPFSIMVHN